MRPWEKPVEREHVYHDVEGNPIATKVIHRTRNDGSKDTSWRRSDPTKRSGKAWNIDGIERPMPLYNAHRLADANGKPVWFPEGEKDCDTLTARGQTAVTNSGGAGERWHPEHAEALRDRDVILPPDNDQKGAERVQKAATGLFGIARSVRVVDWTRIWPDMPEKADITDALENGLTVEDIEAAATCWEPPEDPHLCRDIFSLSASCDAGQVLLGDEWLRRGDINTLVSMAGTGKSVAVNGAAVMWSAGLSYLGINPSGALRIVLFVAEDDRETLGQQRDGLLIYAGRLIGRQLDDREREAIRENLLIDFSREHVGDDFVAKRMEPVARAHKADLLIVNPLLGYAGGNLVENGPRMLRSEVLPALQRLDAGCLVANHTNKLGRDGMDEISQLYAATGGAEMANIPRGILVLNPTREEETYRLRVEKRQTTGWTDEDGQFVREHFLRRSGDPSRPAWISLPHDETCEKLRAEKSEARSKCTGLHVREVFGHDSKVEMPMPDLLQQLQDRCQCCEKTARRTVDGLITANDPQLRIVRTEQPPGGGKKLKILSLVI